MASSRNPRANAFVRMPGIDYSDLASNFGFALRRAQIASFEAFSRAAAGTELTPPRFTALVILNANPGITQTMLGNVLGTARSGAMLLTDWLEERGFAERRSRAGDARAWGLYLTEGGAELLARIRRRVRINDAAFAARLGPRERTALMRLLDRLAR
jgi:DNA-binding MarR family transcriptional regulator